MSEGQIVRALAPARLSARHLPRPAPSTAPIVTSLEGENRLESLLAIADIARKVNDFRPLPETLELICQRLVGMPACDWVAISLISEGGTGDHIWADPGVKHKYLEWARGEHPKPKSTWSPSFAAMASGRAIVVSNVFERPDLRLLWPGAKLQGFRAVAYLPIVAGGRILGTLNCYCARAHDHTKEEVDLLQTAARLAGVAAETALIADSQRTALEALRNLSGQLQARNDELMALTEAQALLAERLADADADAAADICVLLSEELRSSVLVCGPDGKPRAFAGAPEMRDRMATFVAHREGKVAADGRAISDPATCMISRIGHSQMSGTLLISPPPAPGGKLALARYVAALLGVEMETERADRTLRSIARPAILHALARGQMSDGQAQILASTIGATGQQLCLAYARLPDDASALTVARRLNHLPRQTACLTATAERNGLLLLLEQDARQPKAMTESLMRHAGTDLWSAGISKPFTDVVGIPAALEEAQIAHAAAGSGQAILYEDLGPTGELLRQVPRDRATAFVSATLGALLDRNKNRGEVLVSSLQAYLHHRGSLRKAAIDLNVHPNTLQHRLGRVSLLTGLDLHDPQELAMLSIALAWRQMLAITNR